MLKLSLIVVALQKYDLLTVSYPALWVAVFIIFLSFVYRWRGKVKRHQHRDEGLEEAPLV